MSVSEFKSLTYFLYLKADVSVNEVTNAEPVTNNVPDNAVMVGIPARNIGTSSEEFKPYAVTEESKEID